MQIDLRDYTWYQKMKILRVMKGWSQREAAKKCNVGHKVYWNWEMGETYPHKNNRIAIANAFGVSEKDIFEE